MENNNGIGQSPADYQRGGERLSGATSKAFVVEAGIGAAWLAPPGFKRYHRRYTIYGILCTR